MEPTTYSPGPRALRAMAHPVRLRLLALLRVDGPSTASALAARTGLTSGDTSYHLRQLAEHGFIVDDPGRGNGRERWWQAAHRSTVTNDDTEATTAGRDASDALVQALAVVSSQRLQAAVEERGQVPAEWRAASTMIDRTVRLTPDRARELVDAVQALVTGWEEDDRDPVAAPFVLQVQGFRLPLSS